MPFTVRDEAGDAVAPDAGDVTFTKGPVSKMIASMTSQRPRIGLLDWVVAIAAVGFSVPFMIDEVNDPLIEASAWSVVPFALIMAPLLWRRRAPLAALAAMLGLLLLHSAVFGEAVRCGIVLPAMLLLTYSAGARLDARDALIALGLAVAIGAAICLTDGPGAQGAPPDALFFVAPVTLGVWAVGRVVHSRAKLVGVLRARTAELDATRSERARLEVATERARMSAELEALMQRRLSELAQLAEGHAGAYGEEAVDALAEIEDRSRETLEDMRSVVGALRDDGAPLAPQPTLTQLEALLLRAKGSDARLTVEGDPRALPAAVELSAYRIVEQLLGALDDAPDVEVRVRFADAALELAVSGPARGRADEALERAGARVAVHAGSLRTRVRDGRAEALVSLPLFAAV